MNFFEKMGYSKKQSEKLIAFCDEFNVPYEEVGRVLLLHTYPIDMQLP